MYYFLCVFLFLFYVVNAQDDHQPLEGNKSGEWTVTSSEDYLPETVSFCVHSILSGPDEAVETPPPAYGDQIYFNPVDTCDKTYGSPPEFYNAHTAYTEFFFRELAKRIQNCDMEHTEIPYSFLKERPGINLCFRQTEIGEVVSIKDKQNMDTDVIIGFTRKDGNLNYITLNRETRHVPQIKKLYTMYLKKESQKLLASPQERQDALKELLHCDDIYNLYMEVGQKITIHYLLNVELYNHKMRLSDDVFTNICKMIESNINEGTHYTIDELVSGYLRDAKTNSSQQHFPPTYERYYGTSGSSSESNETCSSNSLSTDAVEFIPRKAPPPYSHPPPYSSPKDPPPPYNQ